MTETGTSPTRRYTRLSPATWAEIDALWSTGEPTLAELADRYGCTERALQAHFAKNGVTKGSAAKALAGRVTERVLAATLPDEDVTTQRALEVRESAYANAVMIETMIVARLHAAAADPATTFAAAASVKMLGVAAAALERLHGLKRAALGLGDDDYRDDDLPVLVLHDLSAEEITEMHKTQGDDDLDPGALAAVDNEVVTVD